MYRTKGSNYSKEELLFKEYFMGNIYTFCNSQKDLVFAAGSSMTLDNSLYKHSSDQNINGYPDMNRDRFQMMNYLPIINESDFKNALDKMNKKYQDQDPKIEKDNIKKYYSDTGGVIGYIKTGK